MRYANPMEIEVAGVPEDGGIDLDWSLDAAWLKRALQGALHERAASLEGRALLHVERTGRTVQVGGQVWAKLQVPCARCLDPADVSVDVQVFMVYEPASAGQGLPEEVELTEADLSWETYSGPTLDLSGLVREQILLEVPMRPLCRPDCPGLAHAGAGEPDDGPPGIDPRWKALAKLSKKD